MIFLDFIKKSCKLVKENKHPELMAILTIVVLPNLSSSYNIATSKLKYPKTLCFQHCFLRMVSVSNRTCAVY